MGEYLSTSGARYERIFPPIDRDNDEGLHVKDRYFDCVMVFEVGDSDEKFEAPVNLKELHFHYLALLLERDKQLEQERGRNDLDERSRTFARARADMVQITASMQDYYKNETRLCIDALTFLGLTFAESKVRVPAFPNLRFCLVGFKERNARRKAEELQWSREVDADDAIRCLAFKDEHLAVATLSSDEEKAGHVDALLWDHLYLAYSQKVPAQMYKHFQSVNESDAQLDFSLFSICDRIDLLFRVITNDFQAGGAGLLVERALKTKYHPLCDLFPLHECSQRTAINKQLWNVRHPLAVPLDNIKAYFGTYIALYFAFLQFYIALMAPLAAIGLAFFVYQLLYGDVIVPGIALLAIFTSVWSISFPLIWRRQEWDYSYRWGQLRFARTEAARPQFDGEYRASEVDGVEHEWYPSTERELKRCLSLSLVTAFLLGLCVSTVAVIGLRVWVDTSGQNWGEYMVSLANAFIIMFFNVIYGYIAEDLNDWENYQTESEYENNLILKVFVFRFVNSYASLYYMAFVRRYEHFDKALSCAAEECLRDVNVQLAIIFATQLVVGNMIELGSVWMSRAAVDIREAISGDGIDELHEIVEREYVSLKYDRNFEDYNELIISLGYATLFVIACPIAPLLAFGSALVEMRIDAYKLVSLHQRPFPRQADSIGAWRSALVYMAWAAVITNLLMVCVETRMLEFKFLAPSNRGLMECLTVVLLYIVLYFAYRFFSWYWEGIPDEYGFHIERMEHLERVLLQTAATVDKELFAADIDNWAQKWEYNDVYNFLRNIYFGDTETMSRIRSSLKAHNVNGQLFKVCNERMLLKWNIPDPTISKIILFYRDMLRKKTRKLLQEKEKRRLIEEKIDSEERQRRARVEKVEKRARAKALQFSPEQWIKVATWLKEDLTSEQRRRIFEEVDVDANGAIDQSEFVSLLYGCIDEYITEMEPSRSLPPRDDLRFRKTYIEPLQIFFYERFITKGDPLDFDRFTQEFPGWVQQWYMKTTGETLDETGAELVIGSALRHELRMRSEWPKEARIWQGKIGKVVEWYSNCKERRRITIWDKLADGKPGVDTAEELRKTFYKLLKVYGKMHGVVVPSRRGEHGIGDLLTEMCVKVQKQLEDFDENSQRVRKEQFVNELSDLLTDY